jgi:hypothetical protein
MIQHLNKTLNLEGKLYVQVGLGYVKGYWLFGLFEGRLVFVGIFQGRLIKGLMSLQLRNDCIGNT